MCGLLARLKNGTDFFLCNGPLAPFSRFAERAINARNHVIENRMDDAALREKNASFAEADRLGKSFELIAGLRILRVKLVAPHFDHGGFPIRRDGDDAMA